MYAYVGVHACMHVAYACKSCNQLGKDQLTRSLLRANVFLFLNRIMNLPDALLNDPSVPLYFLVRLRRLQRPLPSLLEAFCFLECFLKSHFAPVPPAGGTFLADVEFLDSSRNSSKKDASRSKLHSSSIERGVGDHAINLSLLGPRDPAATVNLTVLM
jgi:hypothetical protein